MVSMWDSRERGKLTLRTPDMDEMSRPKRPPPIHANVPTMYWGAMNMSGTRVKNGHIRDFERYSGCSAIRER